MLIYHSRHPKNRVTIVGEYNAGKLCMTAARCSDKDNFCRKVGRDKASARLKLHRNCYSTSVEESTIKNFVEQASKLANFISENVNFKKYIKEGITL